MEVTIKTEKTDFHQLVFVLQDLQTNTKQTIL